jgi:hypothetical protein
LEPLLLGLRLQCPSCSSFRGKLDHYEGRQFMRWTGQNVPMVRDAPFFFREERRRFFSYIYLPLSGSRVFVSDHRSRLSCSALGCFSLLTHTLSLSLFSLPPRNTFHDITSKSMDRHKDRRVSIRFRVRTKVRVGVRELGVRIRARVRVMARV